MAKMENTVTNATERTADVVLGQENAPQATAPKRTRAKKAATPAASTPASRKETKADAILKRLRSAKGATLAQLIEATGWQAHSVRGYLSGTVKKKLGLELTSEPGKDGVRRYRVTVAMEASGVPVDAATPATLDTIPAAV